jgi:hypothetical protein
MTSKKKSRWTTAEGLPDDPSEEQAKAAMDHVRPPKPTRHTTTLTLTPEQSAILDALVLILQHASELGTRPMTRAEVALKCFAAGVSEEVLRLPKLPRWSKEDRQLLEKVLGRKLPDSSAL